ncbi:MAG TPA: DUF4833 domain-containing protein [Polyangiaceae bacterium]|jgi:hypothetical protein
MRHLLVLAAAAVTLAAPTSADARQLGEIPSAFTIAKSSNKNEVSYAIDVDDACAPTGSSPVHPYWRMLERSAAATEPLTSGEQRAFGVDQQEPSGDAVRFIVRGLRGRPITVHTYRGNDGRCDAASSMTIAGTEARVSNVYVKLSLFGVSYVQLTGVAPGGAVVSERISP